MVGPHCFAMGWPHCLVVGGSHCPVVGGTHGLAVGGALSCTLCATLTCDDGDHCPAMGWGPWFVRCGAHCLVVVRQWMVLGWVGYMVLQLGGTLCGSGWDTHCLVMGWTHAPVMGGHGLQVVGCTLFL